MSADSDIDNAVDLNGYIPDNYELDLRLSTIKPHQTEWFLNSFNAVAKNWCILESQRINDWIRYSFHYSLKKKKLNSLLMETFNNFLLDKVK